MKKAFLAAFLAGLLTGCGETPRNAPGGCGADKTNVIVNAEVLPASLEVDICNSVSVTAIANIATEIINPNLPDNILYLESYNVAYSAITAGAPPIAGSPYFLSRVLPAHDVELHFFDTDRKAAFLEGVTTGFYAPLEDHPAYHATYRFYGRDKFGSAFCAKSDFSFRVGRYNCVLSIAPDNPDISWSDNVTFHISGGIGQYEVHSNNNAVIPSPLYLPLDATSFTVSPNAVGSVTLVKLTVLDSEGNWAIALVTVNP